jgi:predicted dehydrogenase
LSIEELLRAFGECKKARPVALVSGDRSKATTVARQYGIREQNLYDYKTFDRLRDNPDVEVVYVVVPNGLHREFTVRAAQAGKHVLCEKPMATNSRECEEMIEACQKAQRRLMVAYRIQYEPHNRLARDLVRQKKFGPAKLVQSVNAQRQGEPKQWRHDKKLAGGGALPDIGLYDLNTTRFLLGEEPVEVSATMYSTPGDARFREIEENIMWQMRFASGTFTSHMSGYDSHESRRYRVHAPTGWIDLDPAFAYRGLRMRTAHAEGKLEQVTEHRLEEKNQFALEIDHFADCIRNNRQPFTPGEEGLQDHRIMEAIYQSAQTGRPVKLSAAPKLDTFRGPEPTNLS